MLYAGGREQLCKFIAEPYTFVVFEEHEEH
jgi:hypothetical protein